MTPDIRTTPRAASLLGLSMAHDPARNFGDEILSLLNRVWPAIKKNAVPNPGLNWVVYSEGALFAGVEAHVPDAGAIGLERRDIRLDRHASWTHVGPYRLLGQACAQMNRVLKSQGHRPVWPTIEIYGHPVPDESELRTEILMALA